MIPNIASIRKAIYCLNKRLDLLEGGEYSNTVTELSNKVHALESLLDDDVQNPTAAIDKFNEIVAFLNSIDNTETLQELLRDVIQQSYQQNYVTVLTYSNLPVTGSIDTIYRVSNYNGSTNQVDSASYSEYTWDGTNYTLLCVKSQIGEVFDISEYHGGQTYLNLSAALGTNGSNVPENIRKGGMLVKFVQNSDNKYVQYRCIADEFTIDVTKWAICVDNLLEDNPEFIYVLLGKDKTVFLAVRTDGTVYFGAGVPKQIVEYVQDQISQLNDDVSAILDFVSGFAVGTNLKEYLDETYGEYIENPEFSSVNVASQNEILEGRKKNGTKYVPTDIELGGNIFIKDIDGSHNIFNIAPVFTTRFEKTMVENALVTLNNLLRDNSKLLVFPYITDTHLDNYDGLTSRVYKNSFGLFSSLLTHFGRFSVHLGDIVQSSYRTNLQALDNICSAVNYIKQSSNLLLIRGNHDTNIRPANPIQAGIWAGIFNQFNHIGIHHNEADPNSLYGYFDLPDIKVRVYLVDSYDALTVSIMEQLGGKDAAFISETQLNWLFEDNAISESGWTALVLCHPSIQNMWTTDEVSLYDGGSKRYYTVRKTIYENLLSRDIPVLWLHGDVHYDSYRAVPCASSLESPIGYCLDISFDNAFYTNTSSGPDAASTEKDKYCCGIVTIDTENNVVNDIRIGRGQSRKFHYGLSESDIYQY